MANIPDIVVQAMSRSGNRHPATPESLEVESLSCMHKTKHFRVICLRPSEEKPADPITITVQVADQVQRSALMPSSLNCSEITITPITNCRTPSSSASSRQGEFEKFCTFSLSSHGDYCEFELVPKYLGDGGKKAPVATIIISINGATVLRWQPVVYHPRYGPRKTYGRSAISAPVIQQIAVSLNTSPKPSFSSSSSSFQIFSPLNIEYQPFDTTLHQHQMCRALPVSFPIKQSSSSSATSFGLLNVVTPKCETNNENLTPSFFPSSSPSLQTPLIKQEYTVHYNEDELLMGASTIKSDAPTCPPSPLFPNSHHLLDYSSFNSPQRFLFDSNSNSNPSFLLLENSNPTFVSS